MFMLPTLTRVDMLWSLAGRFQASEKSSGSPYTKMTSPRVLVYGWYNKGNIGDQLFIEAFRNLFLDLDFVFTESITVASLQSVSIVIFGGGSFLLDAPQVQPAALPLLEDKRIFYLGVGVEASVHPIHQNLMRRAELLAIRSPVSLDFTKSINPNTVVIPDLVYCLQDKIIQSPKYKKSVLILPNITVVPRWSDPHWKHVAWEYFKTEFAQFLDWLISEQYQIGFLAMCSNKEMEDHWASAEIISRMKRRNSQYIINHSFTDMENLSSVFSKYETVITQRFHGVVLSEMMRIPHLVIHHHDKLKDCYPSEGNYLSYYGATKHELISQFSLTRRINYSSVLPIEPNIFDRIKQPLQGEE
jgi:polysaccharide pyruvyl transferase WcaK-like protein